jgi:hypothetical protein
VQFHTETPPPEAIAVPSPGSDPVQSVIFNAEKRHKPFTAAETDGPEPIWK